MREKWLKDISTEALTACVDTLSADLGRMMTELERRDNKSIAEILRPALERTNPILDYLRRKADKVNQNETYKCKCEWRKAGLGAEVAKAHQACDIHGYGGPMSMMTAREADAAMKQQAGMLKSKHEVRPAPPDDGRDSRALGTKQGPGREPGFVNPAMCDHANEVPLVCRCGPNCYCRGRSCRAGDVYKEFGEKNVVDRQTAKAEIGGQIYGTKNWPIHVPEGYDRDDPNGTLGNDDRHAFSSGAMSSGRKPDYAEIFDRLTMTLLERTTGQRRYGDNKYGKDNWKQGARDKEFILDRINHGIEHLLTLHRQVSADDSGSWEPGIDDAAAVACCAMFVMEWQTEMRKHTRMMESLRTTEMSRTGSLNEGFDDKSNQRYVRADESPEYDQHYDGHGI